MPRQLPCRVQSQPTTSRLRTNGYLTCAKCARTETIIAIGLVWMTAKRLIRQCSEIGLGIRRVTANRRRRPRSSSIRSSQGKGGSGGQSNTNPGNSGGSGAMGQGTAGSVGAGGQGTGSGAGGQVSGGNSSGGQQTGGTSNAGGQRPGVADRRVILLCLGQLAQGLGLDGPAEKLDSYHDAPPDPNHALSWHAHQLRLASAPRLCRQEIRRGWPASRGARFVQQGRVILEQLRACHCSE
jgi:hypothetical protein